MTTRPTIKRKLTPRSKPAVTLPIGRYLTDDGAVTPIGLQAVTVAAGAGWPQIKIASALGLTASTFKRQMAADDQSLRLAWEKGRADLEHEVASILLQQARDGNVVAAIFYSKAHLGLTDTPQPQQTVGILIVVPDSLTKEQYEARHALPQITVLGPPVEGEPK